MWAGFLSPRKSPLCLRQCPGNPAFIDCFPLHSLGLGLRSLPLTFSHPDLPSPCFKDSCDCISYVWEISHLKDFYLSAGFFLPYHGRYCSPRAIKITSGYRSSVWYRLRCNKRVASGGAVICILECRSGQSPRPFVQLFDPAFLELCLPPA